MKKIMIIAILSLLIVLSGCADSITGQAVIESEEDSIKLGGLFGITGYASFAGEASRNGFVMAIEDSGMDVEYVIEDFQSDFTKTVTAAQKLVNVDKVDVIIGPEWEFAEVVTPIADEQDMLFISPWLVAEFDWVKTENIFSGTASEKGQLERLAEYMSDQGAERIVVIYSNNAWSFANLKVFQEVSSKYTDLEIIEEFMVNQDATDYRSEIIKIKELNPDAVFAILATDNGQGLFNRQMNDLSADFQIYIPFPRAESELFLDTFGADSNGIIYTAPKQFKNLGEFGEMYEARFGKKPAAISAATAYDMTSLVLAAVEEGAKTSVEIKQYLKQLDNYEGYSNYITFNQYGRVASEEVVVKMINGKNPIILQ